MKFVPFEPWIPIPAPIFLILLLCFFPFTQENLFAQAKTVTYYADPSSTPPDMPATIHHLNARVSFIPEENTVVGSAEFTCTLNRLSTDSMVFHSPDFSVTSVTINDKNAPFRLTGAKLSIPVDGSLSDSSPFRVKISYRARPMAGNIYFIGWRPEESGKRKQIWAHRPHGWIPYMDGRITVDMYITFDEAYNVFSNGERIEVTDNADQTRTWHYSMKKNHPFFSTALAIGDYSYTATKTRSGVPLEFWYYSDMPDRVGTTYMHTEKMFDFLEKEIGAPYPYPLYREAPVSDYMYGAMETTTSTIFGDYMQITPRSWWQRNYVNVNAHELAHQWFGNCVAHFVNRDVWLTESFATYYAKRFEKWLYGDEYWQNLRNDEWQSTFDAAAKNSYPVGGSMGGVQRIYQKGSLVLEMLHDLMGEKEFRKAVKHYFDRYAFGYAETNDFVRCVYEATGKPYNWFFDQWILRGGEPDYLVTDTAVTDSVGNRFTLFRIAQVQEINELNGLFRMPVTFGQHYTDGTYDSLTVWIAEKYTEVKMPHRAGKQVAFLQFDPGRKILKKVTFDQPFDRVAARAQQAPDMIDRYDALVALRGEPVSRKWNILANTFYERGFHLERNEALRQLATDLTPETAEIFRQALLDKDAHVRKAALLLLNPVPGTLRSTVEQLLYDSSYVNVEYALEALCVSFPDDVEYYLELTQDMEGWRGKNIRMMWLAIALIHGKGEYLNELKGYTTPVYEFETRMNAFILLQKIKYYDSETLKQAEVASKHWNNKLSGVAREYVKSSEVAK
jgi:aminopeptidase N